MSTRLSNSRGNPGPEDPAPVHITHHTWRGQCCSPAHSAITARATGATARSLCSAACCGLMQQLKVDQSSLTHCSVLVALQVGRQAGQVGRPRLPDQTAAACPAALLAHAYIRYLAARSVTPVTLGQQQRQWWRGHTLAACTCTLLCCTRAAKHHYTATLGHVPVLPDAIACVLNALRCTR